MTKLFCTALFCDILAHMRGMGIIMNKYVSMWGNAISIADRKPENYAKDLTLRYPIHPVFDGDKLKITLDNFCGTQPVRHPSAMATANAAQENCLFLRFIVYPPLS